jgi:hypothetical protein
MHKMNLILLNHFSINKKTQLSAFSCQLSPITNHKSHITDHRTPVTDPTSVFRLPQISKYKKSSI